MSTFLSGLPSLNFITCLSILTTPSSILCINLVLSFMSPNTPALGVLLGLCPPINSLFSVAIKSPNIVVPLLKEAGINATIKSRALTLPCFSTSAGYNVFSTKSLASTILLELLNDVATA